MKVSYNRKEDILMIETTSDAIDYAEEMGPIIVHFSKANKPVLLEILDASNILASLTKATIRAQKEELQEVG
jgi:uncharacterized protein YuzE